MSRAAGNAARAEPTEREEIEAGALRIEALIFDVAQSAGRRGPANSLRSCTLRLCRGPRIPIDHHLDRYAPREPLRRAV
ncbi:MAG: hypothetical protein ACRETZ_02520 [Steroidobacteraceae bacterium]